MQNKYLPVREVHGATEQFIVLLLFLPPIFGQAVDLAMTEEVMKVKKKATNGEEGRQKTKSEDLRAVII